METVKVRIPKGADDGNRLRVTGKGSAGGDLVIETRVKPHPFFRRDGLDLSVRLPVTVDEAVNGATVDVPTPDGTVKLRVPPQSQAGTKLRLKGKGVTRGAEVGDLYAELEVRLPDVADKAFSEAAREAAQAYKAPVRAGLKL
jgi:DnaJ-class molecular chaperone